MKRSSPTTRMRGHNPQITAILKLSKLAVCSLPAITTQPLEGEERVGEEVNDVK
jgi:hypothetical protein